jgi:hypothetical protein
MNAGIITRRAKFGNSRKQENHGKPAILIHTFRGDLRELGVKCVA